MGHLEDAPRSGEEQTGLGRWSVIWLGFGSSLARPQEHVTAVRLKRIVCMLLDASRTSDARS